MPKNALNPKERLKTKIKTLQFGTRQYLNQTLYLEDYVLRIIKNCKIL